MKPGIYTDIPFAKYLAIDAVSNSYMKKLDKCPAAAKVEQKETPALVIGRAAHAYVLEGKEAFFKGFAVAPVCDRRTRDGKIIYADFLAGKGARQAIKAEDATEIMLMANAVLAHPLAAKLLADGVSEQTVIWNDHETGLLCKARPDRLPDEGKRTLIDYKTCESADEEAFLRSVIKYGYDGQAAWYTDGMNHNKGGVKTSGKGKYDSFLFIAQEKKEPYRVEVYMLDPEFLQRGREKCRRLLELEKECREANHWPHYKSEGIQVLYKPKWLI